MDANSIPAPSNEQVPLITNNQRVHSAKKMGPLSIYWNTQFSFNMVSVNYVMMVKTFVAVLFPLAFPINLFYIIFEFMFPLNILIFEGGGIYLRRQFFFNVLSPLKNDVFKLNLDDQNHETNIKHREQYWILQDSFFKVQPIIVSNSECMLYGLYFSEIVTTLSLFVIYHYFLNNIILFWSGLAISLGIDIYFYVNLLRTVFDWKQKLSRALNELKKKEDLEKAHMINGKLQDLENLMSKFVEYHNELQSYKQYSLFS
mmetsp:Transcript_24285/g.34069  ORF Transcript_24285/g.34069 Transcript_24285/m.34069 type:complete len:258 (+) Transcript_24285:678-1451(+)